MPPERRAYPTAPTLTRPSYARPGTKQRSGTGYLPPPIPATVWTCPPAPSEPTGAPSTAGTWAAAIIAAIVAAFSEPHGRVGILPWPLTATLIASPHLRSASELIYDDAVLGTASGAEQVSAVITAQRRIPLLLGLPVLPVDAAVDAAVDGAPLSSSRQARLAETPVSAAGSAAPPEDTSIAPRSRLAGEPMAPPDLIISGVAPALVDEASATRVALAAGPALRLGGVLTVLTHSHHVDGRLVDPGGRLVSAAQTADLLYLQHIVVLHTPATEPTDSSRPGSDPTAAHAREWPVRHRRTHTDLYVFGQHHDHHKPDVGTLDGPRDGPLDGTVSAVGPASNPAAGGAR